MMVLSRKPGERIVIGSDIVVTVISVDGDRAKLAFDAPLEVPILRPGAIQRLELIERMHQRV